MFLPNVLPNIFGKSGFFGFLFRFGVCDTPDNAQKLLLTLHSGIMPDSTQGTLWGARNTIWVNCVQIKYLPGVISLAPSAQEKSILCSVLLEHYHL